MCGTSFPTRGSHNTILPSSNTFPNFLLFFFQFLMNLLDFLSEKRGCGKKFDDQFLAKTDKYLHNFYIIN